jgi:hypothetical protein
MMTIGELSRRTRTVTGRLGARLGRVAPVAGGLVGHLGSCADGPSMPSAQVSCGFMNFFATPANAAAWAAAHPEVTGKVLGQKAALRLGRDVFGRLLAGADPVLTAR